MDFTVQDQLEWTGGLVLQERTVIDLDCMPKNSVKTVIRESTVMAGTSRHQQIYVTPDTSVPQVSLLLNLSSIHTMKPMGLARIPLSWGSTLVLVTSVHQEVTVRGEVTGPKTALLVLITMALVQSSVIFAQLDTIA